MMFAVVESFDAIPSTSPDTGIKLGIIDLETETIRNLILYVNLFTVHFHVCFVQLRDDNINFHFERSLRILWLEQVLG